MVQYLISVVCKKRPFIHDVRQPPVIFISRDKHRMSYSPRLSTHKEYKSRSNLKTMTSYQNVQSLSFVSKSVSIVAVVLIIITICVRVCSLHKQTHSSPLPHKNSCQCGNLSQHLNFCTLMGHSTPAKVNHQGILPV